MSKCYASDVIAVAVANIGYKEKATNSQLNDPTANAGSNNWNKFAAMFDEQYPQFYNGKKNGYHWCDIFVDGCFILAFGYEDTLRLLCQPEKSAGAGCTYSYAYYKRKGRAGKEPKVGAQIFFGYAENNLTHTGIVEKYDSSYVYTIEGNTSDMVARRKYSRNAANIFGYGYPAYDGESDTTAPSTSTATPSASGDIIYRVVKGDSLSKIAATYGTTYQKLAEYNGISNPNVIVVGQAIKIPKSATSPAVISVGSKVRVQAGAKTYTGGSLASYVFSTVYDVIQVNGDRVVIGLGTSVTAAMNAKDLTLA